MSFFEDDAEAAPGAGAAALLPLATHLVAYWKFEEASGTRADSVGSMALSDNNGVGRSAGQVGNAASFGGSPASFLTSSSTVADIAGGTFFALARFRPTTLTTGNLISKRNTNSLNIDYAIRIGPDGSLAFFTSHNDSSSLNSVSLPAASVANGAWHAAIAYYDLGANLMGLSLDGAPFVKATPTFPLVAGGPFDQFVIGAITGGAENFVGLIDAAGIGTNYVPSDADAATFWASGNGFDWV